MGFVFRRNLDEISIGKTCPTLPNHYRASHKLGQQVYTVEKFVRDCFEDLKNQEAGRAKNGRLESGPGQFGVVRRVTAEEDTMENNTMYSCGSLAPKMKATV